MDTTDLPTETLSHIARCLDAAKNLHGARLSPEHRARVFAAIETGTYETWNAARSVIVGRNGWTTLWQAVAEHTGDPAAQPTPRQIIDALHAATLGKDA